MAAILEAPVDVATSIDPYGSELRECAGGEDLPYGGGPATPLVIDFANSRYRDRIRSVLPDPARRDAGHEVVTLENSSDSDVELSDWMLRDRAGNEYPLSGQVRASAERALTRDELHKKSDLIAASTRATTSVNEDIRRAFLEDVIEDDLRVADQCAR